MARTQAYDHPAYLVPYHFSNNSTAGASSNAKWSAFTDMVLAQCVATVITAGTGTSTAYVTKITAAGTATTTIGTLTQLATGAVMVSGTIDLADTAVAVGDVIQFTNVFDLTAVYSLSWEYYLKKGASLHVA